MSRILIIEDEKAIAELEKDYLELSGFEVEVEEDGEKGLLKALNGEFDLFILDLMLPGIDGFDHESQSLYSLRLHFRLIFDILPDVLSLLPQARLD